MGLVDLGEPGVDDLLVELVLLFEAEDLCRLLGERPDQAVEHEVMEVGVVHADDLDFLVKLPGQPEGGVERTERLRAAVDRLKEQGCKTIVVEASVLLERGDPEKLYETVVVVTAPETLRIERTMKRLGITDAEVRDRMRHQMPEDEKIKRADHVIVNDGSADVLETRARKLWGDLMRTASKE